MHTFFTLLLLFILTACSREEVTVQVVRNPLIEFSGGAFNWRSETYSFRSPIQVVQYPANTGQPGRVYTRYTLQATGRDSRGQRLQLNVSFDAAEGVPLRGEYRPSYTDQRGLAAVQLYNLDQASLAAYQLSTPDTASARFVIQRQSTTENLLAGTFQMTLSDERNPANKIVITNGVFTDIRYNP